MVRAEVGEGWPDPAHRAGGQPIGAGDSSSTRQPTAVWAAHVAPGPRPPAEHVGSGGLPKPVSAACFLVLLRKAPAAESSSARRGLPPGFSCWSGAQEGRWRLSPKRTPVWSSSHLPPGSPVQSLPAVDGGAIFNEWEQNLGHRGGAQGNGGLKAQGWMSAPQVPAPQPFPGFAGLLRKEDLHTKSPRSPPGGTSGGERVPGSPAKGQDCGPDRRVLLTGRTSAVTQGLAAWHVPEDGPSRMLLDAHKKQWPSF